jgi:DNA-binding response OmpR family regulator
LETNVKPLVLFVEDNPEIVGLLTELVPMSPVDAAFARSASEAREVFLQNPLLFEAILVDRRLPDKHGDILARELRSLGYRGILACYSSDRVLDLDLCYDASFRKSEPVFQVFRKLSMMIESRKPQANEVSRAIRNETNS